MTEHTPVIGQALVAVRDVALRWRLTLLWFWVACFPFLMFLYWSPDTAPPTAIGNWEVGLDKPIHMVTHGFMVFIPTLLMLGRWRGFAIAAGFAAAVTLEFGQLYVPGRSFELLDITANVIGAGLGWYVGRRLRAL